MKGDATTRSVPWLTSIGRRALLPFLDVKLRDSLLAWYDEHARNLPWRRTRDPYAIWVSEVMLQQTRVDTVIPYFSRFLDRFPTARALAAASEDEVLSLWSGLGYYRRARLLYAGVREVVEQYGGEVPRGADALRALPGVGRYTAGAIGSIAFGREEALVDGNVARVLARLHAIEEPLGRADTERRLWAEAATLVRGPRPGALNQALMELGATVCVPKTPLCAGCPIAFACSAHRVGRTAELPVPRKRVAPQTERLVAVVATVGRPSRVLFARGVGGLFDGLWGPPTTPGAGRDAARRALREAGIAARLGARPVATLEHVLTHRVLRVQVWRASAARTRRSARARAFEASDLSRVGVSRLTRRILAASQPPS